jgi:protein TonB
MVVDRPVFPTTKQGPGWLSGRGGPVPAPSRLGAELGAWRYRPPHSSRQTLALALLLSASFHLVVFFGFGRHRQVVRAKEPEVIAVRLEMPILKELEEPDPLVRDDAPPPDNSAYAPALPDAPTRLALPTDFVQAIDLASLVPSPDLTSKVFVIPEHIRHAGKIGDGLGNIFNLADLDRVPEPLVQPSPVFPPSLKREVDQARVVVEFVVDTQGRVVDPMVVDTTHNGFDAAAVAGVARWKFRPGVRAGRNVNTRMQVPIIFRLRGDE